MAELLVTPWSHEVAPPFPTQTFALWSKETQGYRGRVVVLADAHTQSQAEHWMSFFRSTRRGIVVGGRTSGANGTITGVQLPGGHGMTFTGMVVRHPDGGRFHAIGHVPDVEVEPSIDDLRSGRDTVLLRALREIAAE
jgi:C-terminal processing protease CtpA/Prc